jgi:serine/threonine protein kinase
VLNETTLKTHGLQCGLKVFAQIGQKFGGSGWILAFCRPGNSFLKNCTKGPTVKFFGRAIDGSLSGHFHLFFKNVDDLHTVAGEKARIVLNSSITKVDGKKVILLIGKTGILYKPVTNEILVGTTCISRNIARTIIWSEDTKFYYIVIEYVQGQNLLEIIEGNKGIFWREPLIAIEIIVDILKGLVVLHSHNFIHRDLKLENIMVSLGDSVKIIDFGFSVPVSQLKDGFSGTLNYIPPEAVSCFVLKNRSQKIDIWAIGVIIYLMLFGKFPYEYATRVQLIEFMRDLQSGLKKMRFLKKLPESSDANIMILYEVMKQCFQINPKERPSSEELLAMLGKSL